MTDLHKFLVNPFDDGKVGVDALLAFATDHHQRLASNNAGNQFTSRITATATALAAVNAAFSDDQTKLAQRKGRKLAKDNFRKALPSSVAKLHASVVAKYGPKAVEVLTCFPLGRGVFNTVADDQLSNQLQTLIVGLTSLQSALGASVVTDATALLTGWTAVYAGSENATGAKTTTQATKKAAREALQLELFKNLMTLALAFPRQPEVVDTYMRQALLEGPESAPTAVTPPAPTPAQVT
jgi:hypothetical protein